VDLVNACIGEIVLRSFGESVGSLVASRKFS